MSGVVFNMGEVVLLSGTTTVVPTYAIPADITEDDIVYGTLLPIRRISAVKSITLSYARNHTPMPDSIAGTVWQNDPDLAAKLSAQYSTTEQVNSELSDDDFASSISTVTLIVNEADAITEGQRRLAMSATPRRVFELDVLAAPFALELADIKTFSHPDYFDADGGHSAVITRIIDRYTTDKATLEIEV